MQARSLNSCSKDHSDQKRAVFSGSLTPLKQLLLLVLNLIPLLHISVTVGIGLFSSHLFWARFLSAGLFLYLVPPLLVRILLFLGGNKEGKIPIGSREFFLWWASFQLQMIFCRIPALEELLRFIPGVYSFWLRIWGSEIGQFTFWSPGTTITDRSFLKIGKNVIFGAGVRLNPHVIANADESGMAQLLLGRVEIGDSCSIGGYSLLTAGTKIENNQTTKAFFLSPPFSIWKDGKRIRVPPSVNTREQEI